MKTLLERAILALHPTAQPLADYELRDIGAGVFVSRWSLPGQPPADDQIAALAAQYDAAETTRTGEAIALRNRVLTVAQTAVGVQLDALTAVQVRALMACLLWKAGGLTPGGAIRPLGDWL